MGDQQHSRISMLNFGKQLLGQDEKQFEMNNTWVPITPERPVLVRSDPVSDWPVNQMRRADYQEFPIPTNDYMTEKLLHYHGQDQHLHLIGQFSQTAENNIFDGNSADRNSVLNHIASHYTRSNRSNSNTLELILNNNATDVASANRYLDTSITMAARNPLLPKFYPQASRSDSCVDVPRCNIHSASDIVCRQANRLLIPNTNSGFSGSNSNSLLNSHFYCSEPNQPGGIYSEMLYGDSYPNYYPNYVPVAEAVAPAGFINSIHSTPIPVDQLKFTDSQFCTVPDYTIAESTSWEKEKQKDLVLSTENEIQEYCDGLLQQIVDPSSAAISTTYEDQKGSDSSICGKGSDLGFDLNKTPEQKASKRRKHRPKVIVETKPKRNPKPAIQKTQMKVTPRKKGKNVPKTAATPQTDVIERNVDSTVAAKKSCRKALNFELEASRYETQRKTVCQQIHHRNEKAFNTASDHKVLETPEGAAITYDTNSALLINKWEELTVETQEARNTDDNILLLHEKLTTNFPLERKSTNGLSETLGEQQIAYFPATEKGTALGNSDRCQERNNGCIQQYIQAKEFEQTLFQSETCFENCQNTQELLSENALQPASNNISKSIDVRGSKRKYCNSTENQRGSATNPPDASFCQETLHVDGDFKTATPAKVKKRKTKKPKNRLNAKVSRRSSCQKMRKENSQKARIEDKNGFPSQSNEELPNSFIENNSFLEQQNSEASTDECFATSGEPHQIYSSLIEEITSRLNALNLRECNMPETEGQKALVPYNGDGSIVPYQEFESAKKHRPKVDLDPETEKTWKQLMRGSKFLEGTDKEKEKWWEGERNVFHGRVDSFIARMHLIQGDRRFSKWKGSVVDSVIGVFLTQNVSDHLSSSAFMSLAAKFPHKPKISKRSYDFATDTLLEEAELCIVNPADRIISYGRGTVGQPTYHFDFEIPHLTRELWTDSETSRIKGSQIKPSNQEEELLSSQDSLDSSITQDVRIRSSSGSNSESEGLDSRLEPRETQFLTSMNSLQVGKSTLFQEFYNSVNGVSLFEERTKDGKPHQAEYVKQNCGDSRNNSHNIHSAFSHPSNFAYSQKQRPLVPSIDYELPCSDTQGSKTFQMNGGEFSWTEAVSVHSKFRDNNYRFDITEVGDTADQPEMQCVDLPAINLHGPLSKHLLLPQDTSQSGSHTNYNQTSANHHLEGQKTLVESWPDALDSEKSISAANRLGCTDNNRTEPEPIDKKSKSKVSRARKAKPETEKKNAGNWDKLRKEVQENGTKKERSADTMDSLNYEAVRCASVKEISDTIRERGMNNMLAERIKEFLNRLVTEHGSIDLEWLRDVPPDKTKDYLLSIRGLGLKSVECVRLLTLHHIAFPVDTNVGRIAVRLGWVPLQPLPEALQLHLLELYPVLESVQKYLWPRLCKLDQRTLYELHYQMITFGKVFCTKKKPNCNACPMRAECRHFASAFASARLALPGPEEKCIVSMPIPIAAEGHPSINKNPVILCLPENNSNREVGPGSGQCEPIIEEPPTPERWTEESESDIQDIEDFYREDTFEIYATELNTEESVLNVQNCLQEYKEGDMSRALVALTPQSASMPTPKLKNVSRLRTEHQVYELPDSHPLLEMMDKREPDDPSPYLLAIWSPGETANSIEPPESRCKSQDSMNLCNDQTCFSCNSIREANSQTVRGTLLIPCRTATRGSFPLNGTYFQVNELFADHASSIQPIDIPREWIWNLPRRTVYFGTSVSSIFKGLSMQEIQHCFWRGYVCVRGFDQQARTPRPLQSRLHFIPTRSANTEKRKQG